MKDIEWQDQRRTNLLNFLDFSLMIKVVILNTQTPAECKVTNEKEGLSNNERFVISKIEGDSTTMKHD